MFHHFLTTLRARRRRPLLVALALSFLPLIAAMPSADGAHAANSAVIVMYHRFGEESLPSTNIRLDQFQAQIAELKSGKYTVLGIPEILAALKNNQPLPERTIGITIDDGYASVYREAFPRLQEAGLPFTVFISTASMDSKRPAFMSWDQVREMTAKGVTIGAHTASHLHMADSTRQKNTDDIVSSNARFREELGFTPEIFAYPYGESGLQVRNLVVSAGYNAAFGQHSGVLYPANDFFNLPRFALNETYGSIDRFRQIINALPLPVTQLLPTDMVLGNARPSIGFTIAENISNINKLACYPSANATASIEHLGFRRVEVRLSDPLPLGRSRLNCTLPGPQGRWRWLGLMFYRPAAAP